MFFHIPDPVGMEKVHPQEADTETKKHGLKHKRPTDTSSGDFPCELCNFRSAKKWRIKEHVNEVHAKIKDFACSQCNYKSARKSNLKLHVNAAHTKSEYFACTQCDYMATRSDVLQNHVKAIHDKLSKKCRFCPFTTRYNLDRHYKAVHFQTKNHECDQCDYKTHELYKLKRHKDCLHSEIKRFKCRSCEYRSGRMDKMKGHEQKAHGGRGGTRMKPNQEIPETST